MNKGIATRGIAESLKLLADENRLRFLNLLEQQELSVQELVTITGLGQSRVSHHLGLLRSAGWIRDRREGTWTFYRMLPAGIESTLSEELWRATVTPFRRSTAARHDAEELLTALARRQERSRNAHDALAGVWRVVGQNLERGSLRAEALAALAAPSWVVADLGCGAGFFTKFLAERVGRVIAVDHSPAMLEEAQKSFEGADLAHPFDVEFRPGELQSLPLADAEVDAVVANLVLHHLAEFEPVVEELGRVIRPGGTVVISDLRPHTEEWMREEMGDLRLGIEPEELQRAFRRGPFENVQEITVEDRYRMRSQRGKTVPLELFFVRAQRRST